ncbi:MAG TPA: prolipoprotein diacylglyceryl transferase [Steroidobacteraceae bacterium]|nr:prolipoprotein diacylglyceryl transferase [Steroidobacteraceae bacterium]
MIVYPDINPIAFQLGPIKVHWYGIMYLFGFAAGWLLARRRAARPGSTWKPVDVDDLIFFAMVGGILGGRLGYVLIYGLKYWTAHNPWYPFEVWDGGMSIHGGFIGGILALVLFARRRGRSMGDVFDFTAPLPAPGLFFGRIGNFINGELWGKPTTLPWGFVVDPRHLYPSQADNAFSECTRLGISPCILHVQASQLYEGFLEGIVLFIVMWWFTAKSRPRLAPSGLFLLLYGIFRFLVEFVRMPDPQIGYKAWGWLTMGQILSLPMILIGGALLTYAYSARVRSGNFVTAQ